MISILVVLIRKPNRGQVQKVNIVNQVLVTRGNVTFSSKSGNKMEKSVTIHDKWVKSIPQRKNM